MFLNKIRVKFKVQSLCVLILAYYYNTSILLTYLAASRSVLHICGC